MGDRHGGRFARRGRTLSPPRPQVDAHRGVGFRWRARAKEFAPRKKALLGESLPTRRTGERICPREKALLRESIPTRRTSERICPAQEHAPRRRPPDTAHERKDLPRARTLSSAKASRHGAKAKGFAPRENAPHGEGFPTRRTSEGICPAGFAFVPRADERRAALGRRTARKTPLRRGRTHSARGHCRVHSPKKIRLLHETQLFYGESHVGSRQIFPSFPSVGRCAARERNPVPPVAPHRGSEPRGLRRTGEMVRRFDAMCPRGGEWLPRGGRCGPSFRCFGERFHRLCRANPDACRGRRCSHG